MTKEKKDYPLYAVYGSLRKGDYNHKTYLENREDIEYVGTYITDPIYKMISIGQGSFPGLLQKGDTSVTLEIYKIKSKSIERELDGLEGYYGVDENNMYDKDIIDTPYGPSFIYFYNWSKSSDDDIKDFIVESGDWIDYKLSHSYDN